MIIQEGTFRVENFLFAFKCEVTKNYLLFKIVDSELINGLYKKTKWKKFWFKLLYRPKNYHLAWVKIIESLLDNNLTLLVELTPPNYYFLNEQNRYSDEINTIRARATASQIYLEHQLQFSKRKEYCMVFSVSDKAFLRDLIYRYENENYKLYLVDMEKFNLNLFKDLIYAAKNETEESDIVRLFDVGVNIFVHGNFYDNQLYLYVPNGYEHIVINALQQKSKS